MCGFKFISIITETIFVLKKVFCEKTKVCRYGGRYQIPPRIHQVNRIINRWSIPIGVNLISIVIIRWFLFIFLSILWIETLVWRLWVGCFVRCYFCWSRLISEIHRRNPTSLPYFITGFLWYFYIYYLKRNVYNPKGTIFTSFSL